VLSRGLETIGKEAELPMIVGAFRLATTDLISLMMRGVADGNVGAFKQDASANEWPSGDVGLLSNTELSTKIPVADGLKFPKLPVYILHGGDHFTTLFQANLADPTSFYHWNGLPPGGPRLTKLLIKADKECERAPKVHKETYFKPMLGEIEDIIQANKQDKEEKPEKFDEWRYEVVLAADDPSVQGQKRPDDYVAEVFELQTPPSINEKWTCATCYRTRFQTMCFGANQAGNAFCQHCGKTKADAGWALWLTFKDLPNSWKRKMAIRHAPKIYSILWSKFPDAQIIAEGENPSV